MSPLVLYGTPVSIYTAKVRVALCAKGVTFEERQPAGGYRSEAWRDRVPTGTIPALEVDGVLIAESEAIIEYLEDAHPEPSLLPGSPLERAQARFLARFHDLHFEPAVRALFPLVKDGRRTPQQVATASAAVQERLEWLGRLTKPRPFLAGATLTVADCGLGVTCRLAQRLLAADVLGMPLRPPQALAAWLVHLDGQPAVRTALGPWHDATDRWVAQSFVPTTP